VQPDKVAARAPDEVNASRAVELPGGALDGQATKPQGTTLALPLDAIIVGERHRKDMGDVEGLAASIAEVGLLQPIAVTFDGHLIAGERRLRAVKMLGWKTIPYTTIPINLDQIVRGEFAENTCRKDFTLSEAVAIKRALEPLEKAAAKERQREGGRAGGKASGNLPQASIGRAADKAAKATGMARRTLEKAETIVDAAEADPGRCGKFKEDMDRTGRVSGPYKRLRNAQKAEWIRAEPPPLPGKGPYRVIVADPPWPYELARNDPSTRGVHPYPTMRIDEVCALPVAPLAADDCVLWLWVPSMLLANGTGARVVEAWGFSPRTILTWAKNKMGNGSWLRGQTEHCILAVRGKPTVTLTNETTLLHAPVRGHSEKPPEFYDLVESLCPAPRYADLFSRYRHNERWDCHGDEAPPADDGDMLDIPAFLRRAAP
jgi:N6-adenosine-specific RNA methylase IME4